LNGQFYQSSPEALPVGLKPNSAIVKHWAKLTQPEQGKKFIPTDTIYYLAEPVTKGKTHGVFVVTHFNSGDDHEVNEAVSVAIVVMIAVLAVTSVLAWVVAGRVLAPLRLLTETVRLTSESDLTRRIPVQGIEEISELTITFNEMLDRLQAVFASHELRTPITIIRGHLELLGDDPQERRETVELITDELYRMSRFVDDLLLLAKTEQANFLTLETVDIGLLTEELYTKARALAAWDWRLENKGAGRIVADRQRLTQAMMNLAQNATQHTTDEDIITLGSTLTNGNACFWVCVGAGTGAWIGGALPQTTDSSAHKGSDVELLSSNSSK
jgi:signal transduction histidine kinase